MAGSSHFRVGGSIWAPKLDFQASEEGTLGTLEKGRGSEVFGSPEMVWEQPAGQTVGFGNSLTSPPGPRMCEAPTGNAGGDPVPLHLLRKARAQEIFRFFH